MTMISLRRAVNLAAATAVALTLGLLQGCAASHAPLANDARLQPRPVVQMLRPMLAATVPRQRDQPAASWTWLRPADLAA